MSAKKHVQIVIGGDQQTGKTCMLLQFIQKTFAEEHIPSVKKNKYTVNMTVNQEDIVADLWDTGDNSLECYHAADVILMCFSMERPESLESVESKWKPIIKSLCPKVPIVLVGNKKDLRTWKKETLPPPLNDTEMINIQYGREMSEKIGAYAYCECSAKINEGIKEAFEKAAQAAMETKQTCTENTKKKTKLGAILRLLLCRRHH